MITIIMGASGSGKTTVGTLLANRAGWTFVEADDFHSPENIARMAAGIPLTDADRQPWLLKLRDRIRQARAAAEHIVLACSALRRDYRDLLTDDDRSDVQLVWLAASPTLLADRVRERVHFFTAELLPSQLALLEPPAEDEHALVLPADLTPEDLVEQIMAAVHGAVRMTRPTALGLPHGGRLALLARGTAAATFLASLYLLLAQHPVGSGQLPAWAGHLGLFALLGGSTGLSVATTRNAVGRGALLIALVTVALYGPLTEVTQYFVGRDAEWSDAAVDIAASLPAFALGSALPKLMRGNLHDRA